MSWNEIERIMDLARASAVMRTPAGNLRAAAQFEKLADIFSKSSRPRKA